MGWEPKRYYTTKEKTNGELTVRNLSKEAQEFYNGTSPLDVYEVMSLAGEKRYNVKGVIDAEWLTFDELDALFCDLAMKEWED